VGACCDEDDDEDELRVSSKEKMAVVGVRVYTYMCEKLIGWLVLRSYTLYTYIQIDNIQPPIDSGEM
jgi:hypothetical protein